MSDYEDYLYNLSKDGLKQECLNYVCTKENRRFGSLMLKLFAQKFRDEPKVYSHNLPTILPTVSQMESWDNAHYEFTHGV